MVIDIHAHTFPDKIAAFALDKMSLAAHIPYFSDGTASGLVKSNEECGIDYAVVQPVITNPDKTSKINDTSVEMNGKNGLIYFAGIHPDSPDIKGEVRRMKAAGIKGFKIHPIYQGVEIDDIRFLRIFEAIAEEDMIILSHCGFDVGYPGVDKCPSKKVRNVVNQIGDFKFICAHMGGWKQWDDAIEYLSDTKVYIDTAVSILRMSSLGDYYSDEERVLITEEKFGEYLKYFGADRILYGSDSPWSDRTGCLNFIGNLDIPREDIEKIKGGNAARLLF